MEQSLLDIKRGIAMKKKTIKESKSKKEVNSYLTGNDGDIVSMMEAEWPEMTTEFKRLQREQYELFLKKQHDYVQVIFLLELCYKQQTKFI